MGSSNRGNANLLLFLFSFHLALLPSVVQCMKWEVPPLRQECFYHHIVNGSTVLVQYQTLSGGSREIDMMVYDPQKHLINTQLATTGGNLAFFTGTTGDHRFCYHNRDTSWTTKMVEVHIGVNDDHHPPDHPLAHALWTLRKGLETVRDGQTQYKSRERAQRDLAEATNEWALYTSVLEAGLSLFVSLLNIFQLKLLFEATPTYNAKRSSGLGQKLIRMMSKPKPIFPLAS